jgi:trehalose 6-phosphate synthase
VTALRSLVAAHEVTWIASAITDEDREVAAETAGVPLEETAADGSPYRLRLVAHDPKAYDWYYNVVSNPVLWFVQHYLWGLVSAPSIDQGLYNAWEDGYVAVNRNFAGAVLEELERQPSASVFFHDYHLYVAPRLVREASPDAKLAHFVHIPWPQPDYWRVLPEAERSLVHDGILANDLIGFHTPRWQRSFLHSCEDILAARVDYETGAVVHEGHLARACVLPISVDPSEFDALSASDAVAEEEERVMAGRPESLVLRVDRTDPSKNIVRGFRAFELYLEAHPEMHERVQMLALLDPSRQDIPEYAEYLGAIQRAARAVNDRFQRNDWLPVDVLLEDNFLQAVGAYKHFDVLLVNAIFDGMNLVAKEAPLVNRRDGVVILSENTGAHAELAPWVLTVNPFDVAGQAEAIHEALTMSESERKRRIQAIRSHVREHDIEEWIDAQLTALDESVEARGSTLLSE